jgi:hypothetical protein
MRHGCAVAVLFGVTLGGNTVGAAEPFAAEDLRRLSANPNRAVFGLEYRTAWRATLGAEMPLLGRPGRDEWALALAPLVELHNGPHPDSFVPNEYWRARIGAEIWWSPLRTRSLVVLLGLAVEHESDHSTARVDSTWGFTTLNDAALKQLFVVHPGALALGLGLEVDLFAWSCTRWPQHCTSYGGTTTAGGALDLVADFADVWSVAGWQPYLAVEASGLLGRGEVAPESRIVARAGAWQRNPSAGLFQLFLLGFVGNDLGILRTRRVQELGVGFAWSPL